MVRFRELVDPAALEGVDQAAGGDPLFGVRILQAVPLYAPNALAEEADAPPDDEPGQIGVDVVDVLPLQAEQLAAAQAGAEAEPPGPRVGRRRPPSTRLAGRPPAV